MKMTRGIWTIATILLAIIASVLVVVGTLNYINMNIGIMFVGITQIFIGINQMNIEDKINLKGTNKLNKIVGLFGIILGIVIIMNVIIKMII